jgi:membrane-bound lytic murein transglycosylase D
MKTACLVKQGLRPVMFVTVQRMVTLSAAMLVITSSVGCGFISSRVLPFDERDGDKGAKAVSPATEPRNFTVSSKGPKQLPVQSARVLPKPEFGLTPEVQRELDRYMAHDRMTVLRVLDRHSEHVGQLGKVFEDEGVPAELLSVAAVESQFNPEAKSPAGARGMWQFMRSTAQVYGLKISGRKDERTDPLLSTVAAARHLRDLFLNYHDWHLALAAYNAGSGSINRVVARRGDTDFWNLARNGDIPRETSRFVPRVIALSMIVSDPQRYGFNSVKVVS